MVLVESAEELASAKVAKKSPTVSGHLNYITVNCLNPVKKVVIIKGNLELWLLMEAG